MDTLLDRFSRMGAQDHLFNKVGDVDYVMPEGWCCGFTNRGSGFLGFIPETLQNLSQKYPLQLMRDLYILLGPVPHPLSQLLL